MFDDLGFAGSRIAPASADASFRRYFRVTRGEDTYIVMDAPPEKEDLAPFLSVAKILLGFGLNVPVVLARDSKRGFLLLSDLGQRQYLDELAVDGAADRLYADALAALATMQTADCATAVRCAALQPRPVDARNGTHARMVFARPSQAANLRRRTRACWIDCSRRCRKCAWRSARTFVHRDYHSRNLLLTVDNNPGILDFQDAVRGPVTYDLVSLLKDCYIAWPASRVRAWALQYRELLLAKGFPVGLTEEQFIRGFDLVGLQRHIKVLGIFARLYYRDGKAPIPQGSAAGAALRAGHRGAVPRDG